MSSRTRASSPGGTLIQSGTLANRPASGIVDRYYWATDIQMLFRDTGAVWQVVGAVPFIRWITPLEVDDYGDIRTIAANRMSYAPFQIPFALTVSGIFVVNGATVGTDSWQMALYDSWPTGSHPPFNRLAISNVTLTSGGSRRQYVPFTSPVQINAGLYYGCAWKNGSTDTHVTFGCYAFPQGNPNYPQWFYEDDAGGPPIEASPTQASLGAEMTVWQCLVVSSIP